MSNRNNGKSPNRGQGRYEEHVRDYAKSPRREGAEEQARKAVEDPSQARELRHAEKKGKERSADRR
jgi:hypothetical protein